MAKSGLCFEQAQVASDLVSNKLSRFNVCSGRPEMDGTIMKDKKPLGKQNLSHESSN